MNALTRIPALVEADLAVRPRVAVDPQLFGAVAAMALWVVLHAGLAMSWLSAGR